MSDPECFDRLCDDLFVYDNFPSALPYLDDLIEKFSNAPLPVDDEGEMAVYFGCLTRREPQMAVYLAHEWHDPGSQLTNREFLEYARKVAYGHVPQFTLRLIPDS